MDQLDCRLHTAWLCQMTREYQDICYQYRLPLHPPVLTIDFNRVQLGSWSTANRTLSLSHFLISEHPWNLTLQVLKHEMAHQMVSEVYCRPDVGHGSLFRECCGRLGLDASFQRASGDLADAITAMDSGSTATGQGRQIIDKVRKLMALGSSDNEHEAALAVQRAGELLARYRLDFAALTEDEGLVHRTIDTGSQSLPVHRKTICAILESCFAVRVICASIYDPKANLSHKTIELLGREEEVAIAGHCYHFLENRLDTLWRRNRNRFTGNGRIAKKSYYLGLLAGFRQTLEQSRHHAQPHAPSAGQNQRLPALQARQLDDFVAYRFPRLRRLRGRAMTMNGEAYQRAVADGRELTLHQPMNGGTTMRYLS